MSFVCIDVWIKSLSCGCGCTRHTTKMLMRCWSPFLAVYGSNVRQKNKFCACLQMDHFAHVPSLFFCVILCILKCSFLLVVVCAFLFFYIVIIMISCHVCVCMYASTHTHKHVFNICPILFLNSENLSKRFFSNRIICFPSFFSVLFQVEAD